MIIKRNDHCLWLSEVTIVSQLHGLSRLAVVSSGINHRYDPIGWIVPPLTDIGSAIRDRLALAGRSATLVISPGAPSRFVAHPGPAPDAVREGDFAVFLHILGVTVLEVLERPSQPIPVGVGDVVLSRGSRCFSLPYLHFDYL